MADFKAGDRVRKIKHYERGDSTWNGMHTGDEDTVLSQQADGSLNLKRYGEGHAPYYFQVIENSSNKIPMTSIKSFIKKTTRKQPEKAFVEAGFMDENEELTQTGREALEYVLWDANKEAIKVIADQIIKANAEKK